MAKNGGHIVVICALFVSSVWTSPVFRQVKISDDMHLLDINDGHQNCEMNGKYYSDGQQISDPLVQCQKCLCNKGTVSCTPVTCSVPPQGCDSVPVKGQCCPNYECPRKASPQEPDPEEEISKQTVVEVAKDEMIEIGKDEMIQISKDEMIQIAEDEILEISNGNDSSIISISSPQDIARENDEESNTNIDVSDPKKTETEKDSGVFKDPEDPSVPAESKPLTHNSVIVSLSQKGSVKDDSESLIAEVSTISPEEIEEENEIDTTVAPSESDVVVVYEDNKSGQSDLMEVTTVKSLPVDDLSDNVSLKEEAATEDESTSDTETVLDSEHATQIDEEENTTTETILIARNEEIDITTKEQREDATEPDLLTTTESYEQNDALQQRDTDEDTITTTLSPDFQNHEEDYWNSILQKEEGKRRNKPPTKIATDSIKSDEVKSNDYVTEEIEKILTTTGKSSESDEADSLARNEKITLDSEITTQTITDEETTQSATESILPKSDEENHSTTEYPEIQKPESSNERDSEYIQTTEIPLDEDDETTLPSKILRSDIDELTENLIINTPEEVPFPTKDEPEETTTGSPESELESESFETTTEIPYIEPRDEDKTSDANKSLFIDTSLAKSESDYQEESTTKVYEDSTDTLTTTAPDDKQKVKVDDDYWINMMQGGNAESLEKNDKSEQEENKIVMLKDAETTTPALELTTQFLLRSEIFPSDIEASTEPTDEEYSTTEGILTLKKDDVDATTLFSVDIIEGELREEADIETTKQENMTKQSNENQTTVLEESDLVLENKPSEIELRFDDDSVDFGSTTEMSETTTIPVRDGSIADFHSVAETEEEKGVVLGTSSDIMINATVVETTENLKDDQMTSANNDKEESPADADIEVKKTLDSSTDVENIGKELSKDTDISKDLPKGGQISDKKVKSSQRNQHQLSYLARKYGLRPLTRRTFREDIRKRRKNRLRNLKN